MTRGGEKETFPIGTEKTSRTAGRSFHKTTFLRDMSLDFEG